jgi:uncharacterized SAM-binding protein YcdF (DUF218 family)
VSDHLIIFGAALRPGGMLSGTLRRRIDGALAFGRRLSDPTYLVTGGLGRFPPAEAVAMRAALIEAGIPSDRILVDDRSIDTLQSAIACARIIRAKPGAGTVYACSSRYHIPRCRLLLAVFGVRSAAAEMPGDRAALGSAKWLYACIRESIAIPYDLSLACCSRMWR